MLQNNNLYRRNGKKVYIKQPEFNEMSFVKELWADKETMEGIGGVYDFSRNKWEMFYKKMVSPTDGKNFYCLIYNYRDKPVGEVSFHGYDSSTSVARFNVKILASQRKKGFGEEAVRLLLEYYFQEFGGKIIMDNIITDSGVELGKKLGFEEVRKNANNSITMRVSRDTFLRTEKCTKTNIEILVTSDMNILDYTMPIEIFKKANKIMGKEIFNIKSIPMEETINKESEIYYNLSNENKENPNVLIIPSGAKNNIYKNKDYILDYILSRYNECDFICAIEEGITCLALCRELDGMLIPKGEWIKSIESTYIENCREVNKNFTDNGKIMLSTNIMGSLELYLNLIKKVGGRDLEQKMEKEIGIKNKS